MAKRKMAKGGFKLGNSKDGARKSTKKQSTALLPQNKMDGQRKKRMAKMEKSDVMV